MIVVCQGCRLLFATIEYNQEPVGDNEYPEGTVAIITCFPGARRNESHIVCTSFGWTPECTECEIISK